MDEDKIRRHNEFVKNYIKALITYIFSIVILVIVFNYIIKLYDLAIWFALIGFAGF
jgi:hypothetical protein